MTIKMDRAGCLTLPRSLVCNHGPPEDVFLVGGCLGCRERKPGKVARVKEFICMGAWACPLETLGRKSSQASRGQEVWFSGPSLLACLLNAFIQPCYSASLPILGCVAALEEWPWHLSSLEQQLLTFCGPWTLWGTWQSL